MGLVVFPVDLRSAAVAPDASSSGRVERGRRLGRRFAIAARRLGRNGNPGFVVRAPRPETSDPQRISPGADSRSQRWLCRRSRRRAESPSPRRAAVRRSPPAARSSPGPSRAPYPGRPRDEAGFGASQVVQGRVVGLTLGRHISISCLPSAVRGTFGL